MKIEALGELTPDKNFADSLTSEKVDVNYFPVSRLRFTLDNVAGDADPAEFAAAAQNFLRLTPEDRAEANECVFKNYTEFVEAVGEDELDFQIRDPADVWERVKPLEIIVKRRGSGDRKVYVLISANCDWEQEHGLQIVYREGKELVRVSEEDGHVLTSDAHGGAESEDGIC